MNFNFKAVMYIVQKYERSLLAKEELMQEKIAYKSFCTKHYPLLFSCIEK